MERVQADGAFSQDKDNTNAPKRFVDAIGVGDGSPVGFESTVSKYSLKFQIILIRIDLIKALCGSNDWR